MGLETRKRVRWWLCGTRARQFKATSYGRDGISSSCSGSESESAFVYGGCGLLVGANDDEEKDDMLMTLSSRHSAVLHIGRRFRVLKLRTDSIKIKGKKKKKIQE